MEFAFAFINTGAAGRHRSPRGDNVVGADKSAAAAAAGGGGGVLCSCSWWRGSRRSAAAVETSGGGQDPASCLGVSGSQSALAASAGDPTRSGWLQTLMMRKMTMTIHIPFLLPVLFGWLHLLHSPSVLFLFQVWGLPLKG